MLYLVQATKVDCLPPTREHSQISWHLTLWTTSNYNPPLH